MLFDDFFIQANLIASICMEINAVIIPKYPVAPTPTSIYLFFNWCWCWCTWASEWKLLFFLYKSMRKEKQLQKKVRRNLKSSETNLKRKLIAPESMQHFAHLHYPLHLFISKYIYIFKYSMPHGTGVRFSTIKNCLWLAK